MTVYLFAIFLRQHQFLFSLIIIGFLASKVNQSHFLWDFKLFFVILFVVERLKERSDIFEVFNTPSSDTAYLLGALSGRGKSYADTGLTVTLDSPEPAHVLVTTTNTVLPNVEVAFIAPSSKAIKKRSYQVVFSNQELVHSLKALPNNTRMRTLLKQHPWIKNEGYVEHLLGGYFDINGILTNPDSGMPQAIMRTWGGDINKELIKLLFEVGATNHRFTKERKALDGVSNIVIQGYVQVSKFVQRIETRLASTAEQIKEYYSFADQNINWTTVNRLLGIYNEMGLPAIDLNNEHIVFGILTNLTKGLEYKSPQTIILQMLHVVNLINDVEKAIRSFDQKDADSAAVWILEHKIRKLKSSGSLVELEKNLYEFELDYDTFVKKATHIEEADLDFPY